MGLQSSTRYTARSTAWISTPNIRKRSIFCRSLISDLTRSEGAKKIHQLKISKIAPIKIKAAANCLITSLVTHLTQCRSWAILIHLTHWEKTKRSRSETNNYGPFQKLSLGQQIEGFQLSYEVWHLFHYLRNRFCIDHSLVLYAWQHRGIPSQSQTHLT